MFELRVTALITAAAVTASNEFIDLVFFGGGGGALDVN
jgi:hypothetical protein